MANTPTTNKGYTKQSTGDNIGTWGPIVNTNFDLIDKNLGGTFSIALTNVNVTVAAADAENVIYQLTGALTGNVVITFPAVGGVYTLANACTGAFTVTIACAGGGLSVIMPQGITRLMVCNGTDIVRYNSGSTQAAPFLYGISVYQNVGQTFSQNVAKVITFSSTVSTRLVTSTWTSNSILTVGADEGGMWMIDCAITFLNNGSAGQVLLAPFKNGVQLLNYGYSPLSPAASDTVRAKFTGLIPLSAGDTLQFKGTQLTGSAATSSGDAQTFLSAFLMASQ